MKSKLLYILALATSLVACTDDYTDWAAPLQSEPENPIDVSLSASAPSAIDIASVEGDSVVVFTATVNAPEGCVLASYKLTLNDTQNLPVSLGREGCCFRFKRCRIQPLWKKAYGKSNECSVSGVCECKRSFCQG